MCVGMDGRLSNVYSERRKAVVSSTRDGAVTDGEFLDMLVVEYVLHYNLFLRYPCSEPKWCPQTE